MGEEAAHLVLRVVAGIGLGGAARLGDHLLPGAALRADVDEFGDRLDLQPPALVVGQVPLEDVQLVPGEDVEMAGDRGERIELARDVEMAAAPGVTRRVGDRALPGEGEAVGAGASAVKDLGEGDEGVEAARIVGGLERHTILGEDEAIGVAFRFAAVGKADRQPAGDRRQGKALGVVGKEPRRQRRDLGDDGCVGFPLGMERHRWRPGRVDVDRRRPGDDGERDVDLAFRQQRLGRCRRGPLMHEIAAGDRQGRSVGKAT